MWSVWLSTINPLQSSPYFNKKKGREMKITQNSILTIFKSSPPYLTNLYIRPLVFTMGERESLGDDDQVDGNITTERVIIRRLPSAIGAPSQIPFSWWRRWRKATMKTMMKSHDLAGKSARPASGSGRSRRCWEVWRRKLQAIHWPMIPPSCHAFHFCIPWLRYTPRE